MPNVLEVQIVGDVSSLEKSLKQAEKLQAEYTASIEKTSKELADNIAVTRGYAKAIDDLNKEYKDGSISSKEYSKQLANLKRDEKESTIVTAELRKELANLKKEQREVGGSFDTASKKVANGGNALMQFSRIAQDAPFGIMGIGNNITATAEAFGNLQKQTGSTGAALKAVASSMLGSGGILLAVSLVTTGLTYMSQNGLTVGDVFDKLTGDFDEYSAALKKANLAAYEDSGVIKAVEDVNQLRTEVQLAKDGFIDKSKVVEHYNETIGKTTGLVSTLDGVEQQLVKNGEAYIKVQLFKATATLAQAEAAKELLAGEKIAQQSGKEYTGVLETLKGVFTSVTTGQNLATSGANAFTEGLKSQSKAAKESSDKMNANLAVAKKYNDLAATLSKSKGFNFFQDNEVDNSVAKAAAAKAKKEAEAAAKAAKKAAELRKGVIPFELEFKPTALTLDDIEFDTGQVDELGNKIKNKLGQVTAPIGLPPINVEAPIESFERVLKAADVLNDGIGSSIGGLGNEIAGSLQTGISALDAFTGSVIHSLADIASAQLAGLIEKKAIATASLATDSATATGNAVVAGTETAAASGPAAAFVLPALVGAAIGFIAASFAGIKFAHGGIVPGGSYTGDKIPAMLNSGEAVMNSQQQANTLMAIANGNSNSLQGNRQSSNFTLETKLRGSDLLLVTKREDRKR